MTSAAITTAAWLLIGISFSGAHQSVDAIRYGSMAECMKALGGMKAKISTAPVSTNSRLAFEPYCSQTKPEWWRQ